MKKIWLILFVLIFYSQENLKAQSTIGRFLLWRPSAESMSMGGTGVSQQLGGFSMYYNPAGISDNKTVKAGYSFYRPFSVFEDLIYHYGAAAVSIDKIGTFAVSVEIYQKSSQLWLDETGAELGWDDETSKRYRMAYAVDPLPWFSFGVSLGYFKYKLSKKNVGAENSEPSDDTFFIDAGVLFNKLIPDASIKFGNLEWLDDIGDIPQAGFSVGISILNFNFSQKMQMIDKSQADYIPEMFLMGFSYHLLTSDIVSLNVNVDFEKQIHEESTFDHIRFGGEARILRILALKAGYVKDTFDPETSYGTWGLGIITRYGSYSFARYNPLFFPTWHHEFKLQLEF
ncbi:MAG: hypothetical protein JW956_13765 [Calditrichaceae bacterium]|nr:hypothetical protein [Calditrichaceae bacterium]